MKRIIFILVFIAEFVISCSKTSAPEGASSSVTIVNAIPYSNPLLMNFTKSQGDQALATFGLYGSEYQSTTGIGYGTYAEVGYYTGSTNLTLVQSSDTFRSLANATFDLQAGRIYSFYLTGADTLHVDTLFSEDNVPYYPYTGDSLAGVRFINLVTGSNPVSVDIQGTTSNSPVLKQLAYKTVSPFQPLSANATAINGGYTFEFRDPASGNLLATYAMTVLPFKSLTMVFYGSPSTSLSVMGIDNY
jgi:hypothetical protein